MNCADLEILLCDYVDGTLRGEQKIAVESHLAECAACAEFARDAAGAVAFMERAAVVEPPAELLTRILFELPSARHTQSRSVWTRFKVRWIEPVLQPRFAMPIVSGEPAMQRRSSDTKGCRRLRNRHPVSHRFDCTNAYVHRRISATFHGS